MVSAAGRRKVLENGRMRSIGDMLQAMEQFQRETRTFERTGKGRKRLGRSAEEV